MNTANGTPQTIIKWPNPSLSRKSLAFDPFTITTPEFAKLVRDMVATMMAAKGVGLSAIQIGSGRRLFVLNAGQGIEVYVNPVIVQRVGFPERVSEGCLSLPGIIETVARYPEVVVEHLNPDDGRIVQTKLTGLRAQAAQHEVEHLDGIMFVDKLPPGKKDEIRSRLRQFRASGWSKTREYEPQREEGGRRPPRREDGDREPRITFP